MSSTKFLSSNIIAIFVLFALASTSLVEKREPKCTEVVIPVDITATNLLLDPTYTLNEFGPSLNSALSNILSLLEPVESLLNFQRGQIKGKYSITGRYCEPEVNIPTHANTLQLLAHPATYDRNYVSLFLPSKSELCSPSAVVWRWVPWLWLQW